eukprot:s295_g14.t1
MPGGTGGVVELPDGSKKDYSDGDVFTVNLGQKGFEFFQNDALLGSWSTEKLPGQLLAKLWLFEACQQNNYQQNAYALWLSIRGDVRSLRIRKERVMLFAVSRQAASASDGSAGGVKSGVVSGNSLMLGEAVGYSQDGDILFENGSRWKRQS